MKRFIRVCDCIYIFLCSYFCVSVWIWKYSNEALYEHWYIRRWKRNIAEIEKGRNLSCINSFDLRRKIVDPLFSFSRMNTDESIREELKIMKSCSIRTTTTNNDVFLKFITSVTTTVYMTSTMNVKTTTRLNSDELKDNDPDPRGYRSLTWVSHVQNWDSQTYTLFSSLVVLRLNEVRVHVKTGIVTCSWICDRALVYDRNRFWFFWCAWIPSCISDRFREWYLLYIRKSIFNDQIVPRCKCDNVVKDKFKIVTWCTQRLSTSLDRVERDILMIRRGKSVEKGKISVNSKMTDVKSRIYTSKCHPSSWIQVADGFVLNGRNEDQEQIRHDIFELHHHDNVFQLHGKVSITTSIDVVFLYRCIDASRWRREYTSYLKDEVEANRHSLSVLKYLLNCTA